MLIILIAAIVLIVIVIVHLLKSGFKTINLKFYDKNRFQLIKGDDSLNVDMVYVITMPQRKEYVKSEMKKLKTSYTMFDAISPNDLTKEDYDKLSNINNKNSDIYKKYTRLPVLLSFIMCFADSLKHGYSTIAIFEDDVKIINENINESLSEFKESNNDVFYMGYCFLNCHQITRPNKNLIELSDPDLLCCHSICIKTKILPGLIEYCFPMKSSSDELFRNYYKLNNIKVCVPKQVYFTQNRQSLESLNDSIEDPQLFKTCKFN
jgi:GR25 family glycosyltransferase involved in LPS biosynthesis